MLYAVTVEVWRWLKNLKFLDKAEATDPGCTWRNTGLAQHPGIHHPTVEQKREQNKNRRLPADPASVQQLRQGSPDHLSTSPFAIPAKRDNVCVRARPGEDQSRKYK